MLRSRLFFFLKGVRTIEKGELSLYALGDAGYIKIDRSQVLPRLDIQLLIRCVNLPNHLQAIKEFRQFDR